MHKTCFVYISLSLIFTMAMAIRLYSFLPTNIVIGFDQARDFFDAVKITEGDLRIIGPTAGNNPNLHHGVFYLYYLAFDILLFGKSPVGMAIWNSFFNAFTVIVSYFLGQSLFRSKKAGFFASIITAFSFYYVSFTGWLSNPTVTLLTVPVFFLGMWKYTENKEWGLPLACFALGLSIQLELFFIYLIPVGILVWIILKPKWPTIKNFFISSLILVFTLSTMILTEVKFKFSGIKSILDAGDLVGDQTISFPEILWDFVTKKWEAFYLNFWPSNSDFGFILGLFALTILVFEIYKNFPLLTKASTWIVKRNLFLIIWYFSPLTMLILGYHNAPWFLIGRPAAAILIVSYLLSKIKYKYISYIFVVLIIIANLVSINDLRNGRKMLLEPDRSATLSKQLEVIDFVYADANDEKFAINTVTNPLYINLVWAYNYDWYAKAKYGYLPSFSGGDQLSPYDILPKSDGKEKIYYLIIDETPRIPEIHKIKAVEWARNNGKKVFERSFNGIIVSKWLRDSDLKR